MNEQEYVVRCIVCGHKTGTTELPEETLDICERCERDGHN